MENFFVLNFPVSSQVVSAPGPLLLTCIQSSAQPEPFPSISPRLHLYVYQRLQTE